MVHHMCIMARNFLWDGSGPRSGCRHHREGRCGRNPLGPSIHIPCPGTAASHKLRSCHMVVSINGGTQKGMVYNGKSHQNRWFRYFRKLPYVAMHCAQFCFPWTVKKCPLAPGGLSLACNVLRAFSLSEPMAAMSCFPRSQLRSTVKGVRGKSTYFFKPSKTAGKLPETSPMGGVLKIFETSNRSAESPAGNFIWGWHSSTNHLHFTSSLPAAESDSKGGSQTGNSPGCRKMMPRYL